MLLNAPVGTSILRKNIFILRMDDSGKNAPLGVSPGNQDIVFGDFAEVPEPVHQMKRPAGYKQGRCCWSSAQDS